MSGKKTSRKSVRYHHGTNLVGKATGRRRTQEDGHKQEKHTQQQEREGKLQLRYDAMLEQHDRDLKALEDKLRSDFAETMKDDQTHHKSEIKNLKKTYHDEIYQEVYKHLSEEFEVKLQQERQYAERKQNMYKKEIGDLEAEIRKGQRLTLELEVKMSNKDREVELISEKYMQQLEETRTLMVLRSVVLKLAVRGFVKKYAMAKTFRHMNTMLLRLHERIASFNASTPPALSTRQLAQENMVTLWCQKALHHDDKARIFNSSRNVNELLEHIFESEDILGSHLDRVHREKLQLDRVCDSLSARVGELTFQKDKAVANERWVGFCWFFCMHRFGFCVYCRLSTACVGAGVGYVYGCRLACVFV